MGKTFLYLQGTNCCHIYISLTLTFLTVTLKTVLILSYLGIRKAKKEVVGSHEHLPPIKQLTLIFPSVTDLKFQRIVYLLRNTVDIFIGVDDL